MSINKIALLLAVLLGHALALCNATAPVDAPWLDAARARCAEIPQCDRLYGVTRGIAPGAFAELVAQAGAANTSVGLDAYVCDRADAQAALDMFVVFLALHPPAESCPPTQEYRPATRSCGYPLGRAPPVQAAREVLEPILLGLILVALAANLVARFVPRPANKYARD